MKKGIIKKLALTATAFAALLTFNATAVYGSETGMIVQERICFGGRIRAERQYRDEARCLQNRIAELEIERSGGRNRERCENRNLRNDTRCFRNRANSLSDCRAVE